MKVKDIFEKITVTKMIGNPETKISSIAVDSRKVENNSLFAAVIGSDVDGHAYIDNAVKGGATAVLCQTLPEIISDNVCYVLVEDSADATGKAASAYYGYPSQRLVLTGVTGTNGKTTTATLLYNLFKSVGYKCGLISTVENIVDETVFQTHNTTPDPITINMLLSQMVQSGCQYCFMEVSSHATVQKRIAGLNFKLGIFSNITLDHLDYHKTFKDYIYAKKLFFDSLPKDAYALINTDDKNGRVMVQNTKAKVKTYGLTGFNDFNTRIIETGFEGMLLDLCGREMWTFLPGRFNAYNITAIYASAVLLGLNKEDILTHLSGLHPVRGRFDIVSIGKLTAVVDYAHTPDALENVLKTINDIRCQQRNIITVCGCGGNRDKSKRPLMARIAALYSDKVILTSDNPRNENPEDILDDMFAGLENELLPKVLRISDRKSAISTACFAAHDGDIILIAGKGHETYQEINGVRHHFDDKEIIIQFLQSLNN